MCIGIPMQIVTREGQEAVAETGGVRRRLSLALLDEPLGPGDWVLVHVGYAIARVEEEEARETLDLLRAVAEAADRA